jgi:hypothetical protein
LAARVQLVSGLVDGPHRLRLVQRGAQTPNLLALHANSPSGGAFIRDAISSPAVPELLTWKVEGEAIVLRWPLELRQWHLEQTIQLTLLREWNAVPATSIQISGNQMEFRYAMPRGDFGQWFRLRAPEPSFNDSDGGIESGRGGIP